MLNGWSLGVLIGNVIATLIPQLIVAVPAYFLCRKSPLSTAGVAVIVFAVAWGVGIWVTQRGVGNGQLRDLLDAAQAQLGRGMAPWEIKKWQEEVLVSAEWKALRYARYTVSAELSFPAAVVIAAVAASRRRKLRPPAVAQPV